MKSQTTLVQEDPAVQADTAAQAEAANRLKDQVRQRSASLRGQVKQTAPKALLEEYDSILWRINAQRAANEPMAVGLTGCQRKSGSTTIAANLAMQASSQLSGRVLLIDANWDAPGLQATFKLAPGPGLYDIVSGELSPRECEPQAVTENLDVLGPGKSDGDRPLQVQQKLVQEMLSDFKSQYDLILVDLPRAEELRCALPIARILDGSLLIARFEAVKQQHTQRALLRLEQDGVPVWGSILNRHRDYVPRWLRHWL